MNAPSQNRSVPRPELRPPLSPQAAVAEAARCLYCFDAPCSRACPCQIDVAEFIRKIRTGNLLGSARLLLSQNPLARSCARVCPVEVLCEGACVLPASMAKPIAIGRLQRHVMDWAAARDLAPVEGPTPAPRTARVAVVGAGPAGLTCAVLLRRLGYAVTVFDERQQPGGLGSHAIAMSKILPETAIEEARWLARTGFELRQGVRVGTDLGIEALEREHEAIFLGLGLGLGATLEVPGEDLPGVVDALPLIASHRQGGAVQPELAGRDVIVIGGGNTALDAAVLALEMGARTSTLVYRRSEKEMPAYPSEVAHAKDLGVRFVFLFAPLELEGRGALERAVLQPMRLGEPDASGRRRPEPVPGTPMHLPAQVLVRALGQRVDEALVGLIPGVRVSRGCIRVDEKTGQTGNPRYFAGGDCVNGGREVVHAVADGKRAALAIHAYLESRPAARS